MPRLDTKPKEEGLMNIRATIFWGATHVLVEVNHKIIPPTTGLARLLQHYRGFMANSCVQGFSWVQIQVWFPPTSTS